MKRLFFIIPLVCLLAGPVCVKAEWVKEKTGMLAWFRTIHFADADNGFIGGSNGAFLETRDGGKTWKPGLKFTSDTIRKIRFTDSKNGWALCERDIYSLGSNVPSYLMQTSDGGRTWTKTDLEDTDRRRITTLVFSENGFGLALGEMGTMFGLADDRVSWKKLRSPTSYLILGGAFADNFTGALVGGGGTILFTEDAGVSWREASLSGGKKPKLKTVHFANNRDGWAAGDEGTIYQTINGGKFWRLQTTGTKADINAVHFVNNSKGWAVGEEGTILSTRTGGNIWRESESKTRNNLEDMVFVGETGWVVGFGGTLLKYEPQVSSDRKPKLNR